jgi:hypothetical protein
MKMVVRSDEHAMRLLVRIMERQSFSAAASDLGPSRLREAKTSNAAAARRAARIPDPFVLRPARQLARIHRRIRNESDGGGQGTLHQHAQPDGTSDGTISLRASGQRRYTVEIAFGV